MNRRDFLKWTCGALGAAVSGAVGWTKGEAQSSRSVARVPPDDTLQAWRDAVDAASAAIDAQQRAIDAAERRLLGMSVPLAVAGEGRFSLIDDDGTALHVYLPQVNR